MLYNVRVYLMFLERGGAKYGLGSSSAITRYIAVSCDVFHYAPDAKIKYAIIIDQPIVTTKVTASFLRKACVTSNIAPMLSIIHEVIIVV